MATYALGDIQGCMEPLQRLLKKIAFNPQQDVLWLAGDMVNRGPASLEVLRWARDLGDRVKAVLGNHDLRLLCIAHGLRTPHPKDTLQAILAAPDRNVLLHWLQTRPLMHRHGQYAMVHAGVLPQWSTATAWEHANAVHQRLTGPQATDFLQRLCTEVPCREELIEDPLDRLVFCTKALTYMRLCSDDGELLLSFNGPPGDAPRGFRPWFEHTHRRNLDVTWICGHWSALGLYTEHHIRALDTGCVWGGALTALRLDDGHIFVEPA